MAKRKKIYKDEKGNYPAYAWPGGYPIIYYTKDGLVVCPKCANRDDDDLIASDIYWEGPNMPCDDCGKKIESAYGDPE